MKKTFLLCAVVVLASCSKKGNAAKSNTEQAVVADNEQFLAERTADSVLAAIDAQAEMDANPKVEEAKRHIDEATKWMKKAIRGEVSKDEANKHIDPAMKEFERLNSAFSLREQDVLQEYRVMKAQEAIDLQIKYGN